jgi:hypothetical protein
MKWLIVIVTVFGVTSPVSAQVEIKHDRFLSCVVADPTGTPLKVRSLPNRNSKSVFEFRNGTIVVIYDRQGPWAFVGGLEKIAEHASNFAGSGWVYFPYLTDCKWEIG